MDVDADLTPGVAASEYDRITMARYDNFVPFIVETGRRINCAGLQLLDKILPAQVVGDAAAVRKRGRALRGISRSLSLQQVYTLAKIVAEIHAPDLAVEGMESGVPITSVWVAATMTRPITRDPFFCSHTCVRFPEVLLR